MKFIGYEGRKDILVFSVDGYEIRLKKEWIEFISEKGFKGKFRTSIRSISSETIINHCKEIKEKYLELLL